MGIGKSLAKAFDKKAMAPAKVIYSEGNGFSDPTISYTTAEKTKVGFITVTQAVDLDDMESNVTANSNKLATIEEGAEVNWVECIDGGAAVFINNNLINDGGSSTSTYQTTDIVDGGDA